MWSGKDWAYSHGVDILLNNDGNLNFFLIRERKLGVAADDMKRTTAGLAERLPPRPALPEAFILEGFGTPERESQFAL